MKDAVIMVIRTLSQPSDYLTVNTWGEGECLLERIVLIVAKFKPIVLHRQAARGSRKIRRSLISTVLSQTIGIGSTIVMNAWLNSASLFPDMSSILDL